MNTLPTTEQEGKQYLENTVKAGTELDSLHWATAVRIAQHAAAAKEHCTYIHDRMVRFETFEEADLAVAQDMLQSGIHVLKELQTACTPITPDTQEKWETAHGASYVRYAVREFQEALEDLKAGKTERRGMDAGAKNEDIIKKIFAAADRTLRAQTALRLWGILNLIPIKPALTDRTREQIGALLQDAVTLGQNISREKPREENIRFALRADVRVAEAGLGVLTAEQQRTHTQLSAHLTQLKRQNEF